MAPTAIVVGAGIGGMACAIALRRANFTVTVLERRDDVKEIGQAMGLTSNACRVLLSLGLDLRKMHPVDFAGVDIVKADTMPMQIVVRQNFPDDVKGPSRFVHRVDCHEALKDLAMSPEGRGTPIELRHGCAVVSYDPEKGTVVLESGQVVKADLIVAADGVRSRAHKWVLEGGEERPAKSTGVAVIRFTIPTDSIQQDSIAAPLLQVSAANKASMYVGADPKGARVLRYPCRDSKLQNFGIYTTTDLAETPDSIQTERTRRDVAVSLLSSLNESVARIATLIEEKEMYLWKVADREPLPKMHKGNMVVVGDACHPMRPNLGQGAGLAIEDGGVLGVVMQDVQPEQIPSRLKLFEDLRRYRTGSAQLLSRCSLAGNPWPLQDDFRNAQQFMGDSKVPTDVTELVSYFLGGDQLREAEEAVASLMKQ